MNQSRFSPYVLEAVLLWPYNETRSQGILEEIKEIEKDVRSMISLTNKEVVTEVVSFKK